MSYETRHQKQDAKRFQTSQGENEKGRGSGNPQPASLTGETHDGEARSNCSRVWQDPSIRPGRRVVSLDGCRGREGGSRKRAEGRVGEVSKALFRPLP